MATAADSAPTLAHIVDKVVAYPPLAYRLWCIGWYVVWLGISAVFAWYLIESWLIGVPIGLVTGLPLLGRLWQPAWVGIVTDGATGTASVLGGYTEVPNWQTPLENVAALRLARAALTGQLQISVHDREQVTTFNRKGLSRGSLRENEARTGAAIEVDFFTSEQVAAVDRLLVASANQADDARPQH
jgi:hypothetical protein